MSQAPFEKIKEKTRARKPPETLLCSYASIPEKFRFDGGQGGIRTPGKLLMAYGGLANRWFKPLTHLSGGSEAAQSKQDRREKH